MLKDCPPPRTVRTAGCGESTAHVVAASIDRKKVVDSCAKAGVESALMKDGLAKTGRMASRLAAIVIVLWWGGLSCLAGCVVSLSLESSETECPVSPSGNCCHSAGDDKAGAAVRVPSPAVHPHSCCTLQSLTAETTRNVRASDVVVPAVILTCVELAHDTTLRGALPDNWLLLPDRGGTHLRCCVFRI